MSIWRWRYIVYVETLLEAEENPVPEAAFVCLCTVFSLGFISIVVTSLSAKTRHHKVLPARCGLVSIFTWLLAWCFSQLHQFFGGCSISSGTQFCVCVCVSVPFVCMKRYRAGFSCQDIFGHSWFSLSCFFSLGPLCLGSVRTHGSSRLSSRSSNFFSPFF